MLFYLITLGLVRFLTEDPPAKNEDEQDKDYLIVREAWNNNNWLGQILNRGSTCQE